jgi:hypothetical protein
VPSAAFGALPQRGMKHLDLYGLHGRPRSKWRAGRYSAPARIDGQLLGRGEKRFNRNDL